MTCKHDFELNENNEIECSICHATKEELKIEYSR